MFVPLLGACTIPGQHAHPARLQCRPVLYIRCPSVGAFFFLALEGVLNQSLSLSIMLVLGPNSTCDVCLECYTTGANVPHAISCGHVFCQK